VETDPDVIRPSAASVEPSEPLAASDFATVDWHGIPTFGAGWFAVPALPRRDRGRYALCMPMTTAQGDDRRPETFSEPRRSRRDDRAGDATPSTASIQRMGFTLADVTGRWGRRSRSRRRHKVDFYSSAARRLTQGFRQPKTCARLLPPPRGGT